MQNATVIREQVVANFGAAGTHALASIVGVAIISLKVERKHTASTGQATRQR